MLSPVDVRHLRAPTPIHFPEAEDVPEGLAQLVVRTFLFQLLQFALGPEHTVGSDQFIYWSAKNPRRCLSPDVFVRLDAKQRLFGPWKTWEEGGAPDLAVEIISPNEGDGVAWDEKLARYHELGVRELVRFDPEGETGKQLRTWDRVDGTPSNACRRRAPSA
jgi:Uma2 family endonuclease